jgi:hypothetical protein
VAIASTIELRPVFHRLEPRIRAHVLLCWLALLLIRVAERRTGQTWRTIARELGRLHAITLTGPAGTVVQPTEPTTAQSGILRACGPPPRSTRLQPSRRRMTCGTREPRACVFGVGGSSPQLRRCARRGRAGS